MENISEEMAEEWAIVEVFGHRSHAGRILEIERFGSKFLRIDMPRGDDKFETVIYGGASIFSITPCTKERAMQAERWHMPRPTALLEADLALDEEPF